MVAILRALGGSITFDSHDLGLNTYDVEVEQLFNSDLRRLTLRIKE